MSIEREDPPMEYIELLTVNEAGNAVEGMPVPIDRTAVVYRSPNEDDATAGEIAHLHKFFRRDEGGRPVPGTLVRFFVPDHLCDGPWPSRRALRLVAQRMGWDRR